MTEEERQQAIAQAEREALWRASFLSRVWECGPRGWMSREPTREDWQRRASVAKVMAAQ